MENHRLTGKNSLSFQKKGGYRRNVSALRSYLPNCGFWEVTVYNSSMENKTDSLSGSRITGAHRFSECTSWNGLPGCNYLLCKLVLGNSADAEQRAPPDSHMVLPLPWWYFYSEIAVQALIFGCQIPKSALWGLLTHVPLSSCLWIQGK